MCVSERLDLLSPLERGLQMAVDDIRDPRRWWST